MNNSERIYNKDESLSLLSVLETLWKQKSKVILTASVSLVLAIIYLFVATPKYTATMIVAAIEQQGNLSGLGARSQLSSISGIKIGETDSSIRFAAFVDLLTSHAVAKRLMKDEELVHKIFEEEWDPASKKWRAPGGIISFLIRLPNIVFGRPAWTPPSSTKLAEFLSDEINVSDFGDAGMKTISFDHKDPAFAVELVQKVYQAADEELKSDTLIRTRKYIAYLEKRLATVTVAEYREALSDLLVDQERTQMVIEADLPFAAKIVSDAVVPDTPDKPKIVVTLIVMTLIGVFLGVLWIFLLENEEGSKQG